MRDQRGAFVCHGNYGNKTIYPAVAPLFGAASLDAVGGRVVGCYMYRMFRYIV